MPVVSDYTALLNLRTFSGNVDMSISSWNLHYDIGNQVFITYSFATDENLPTRGDIGGALSTYVLTAAEQDSIRDAISHIEKKAGLTFVEIDGRSMINFAGSDLIGNFAGKSGLPIVTEYQGSELNTVLDRDSVDPTTDGGREVVLHEIMHALGLEHPFEGVNILDSAIDTDATTLMSYTETGEDFTKIRDMDIEALQYLYGESSSVKNWSYGQEDGYFKIKGASKDDWITGVEGANKLLGQNGDDHLTGRVGEDTLDGGKGDDTLIASRGDDLVKGGSGKDLLRGDGEDLELNGSNPTNGGDDTLKGGGGKDTLYGGGGEDVLDGGGGADMLMGEFGSDTLRGKGGDDILDGGTFSDNLIGGNGDDTLDGGENFDTLSGGKGDDLLTDISGSDTFDGGDGRDTIKGGDGFDVMTGGGGRDVFVFEEDALRDFDTITDFDVDKDTIDMPGAGLAASTVSFFGNYTYNGVSGTLIQSNGSAGYTIHFQGLSLTEVESNWDNFVV